MLLADRFTRTFVITVLLFACLAPLALAQENEKQESTQIRRRIQWFYGQRAYPHKRIPPHARHKALQQLKKMLQSGSAFSPTAPTNSTAPAASQGSSTFVPTAPLATTFSSTTPWYPRGPQPSVPLPEAFAGSPTVSGRVTALAVDPTNSTVVYLGSAEGGVWKTTNGGTNWAPLTDYQASLAIGSMAVAPSDPSVIYAGTGEDNFNGDAYYGEGLLKSTDGGASWTQLPGPFTGPNYNTLDGGAYIGGLAVHPTNSSIVFAAVKFFNPNLSGVYRSMDGGSTWIQVLGGDVATAIAIDPLNPSNVYAAIGNPGGGGLYNGVYKSVDGGSTFNPIFAWGYADVGRIALALSPSNPSTLYVAIQNVITNPGALLGMFKTTDGGNTWTQLANTPDFCSPQCWYDLAVTVAPDNPNVVYAGGAYQYNTNSPTSVIRSLDGGNTWAAVASGANGVNVHTDVHALTFSADSLRLYVGSDGGAWTTSNITTAVNWTGLNATLAITQFYPGLSIHPTNSKITLAGAQDNGTQRYSGSSTWNVVACGDGGFTAIDFLNPANAYVACTSGNDPVIYKSTSGGTAGSFFSAQSGIDTTDRMVFIPPLVMDPSHSQTLYFGTYRVYRSTDGANSWTPISYDLTIGGSNGYGEITAIAAAPSNSSVIYAATDNSILQVTSNANYGIGSTWVDVSAGLPTRYMTQVAVSPVNPSVAYVTFSGFAGLLGPGDSGHVYLTTTRGGSWTDVSGNLPNIPVNDIVIDPDLANTIYVATDIGVFVSTTGGTNWAPLGTGLPQVAVLGLRLQRANRILRVATHGRGVWDIHLPNPLPVITSLSPSSVVMGSAGFTLTVNGSGFVSSSKVLWNGSARSTHYVSSTRVKASILSTDVASAGTVNVTAQNPAPGGGLSNAVSFTIVP